MSGLSRCMWPRSPPVPARLLSCMHVGSPHTHKLQVQASRNAGDLWLSYWLDQTEVDYLQPPGSLCRSPVVLLTGEHVCSARSLLVCLVYPCSLLSALLCFEQHALTWHSACHLSLLPVQAGQQARQQPANQLPTCGCPPSCLSRTTQPLPQPVLRAGKKPARRASAGQHSSHVQFKAQRPGARVQGCCWTPASALATRSTSMCSSPLLLSTPSSPWCAPSTAVPRQVPVSSCTQLRRHNQVCHSSLAKPASGLVAELLARSAELEASCAARNPSGAGACRQGPSALLMEACERLCTHTTRCWPLWQQPL